LTVPRKPVPSIKQQNNIAGVEVFEVILIVSFNLVHFPEITTVKP